MLRAALFRGHSGDDLGAVVDGLLGVEGTVLARDALDEDAGGLVDEDGGFVGLGERVVCVCVCVCVCACVCVCVCVSA
jgi:hypothetical protein